MALIGHARVSAVKQRYQRSMAGLSVGRRDESEQSERG